jgi:hypothetical protein
MGPILGDLTLILISDSDGTCEESIVYYYFILLGFADYKISLLILDSPIVAPSASVDKP